MGQNRRQAKLSDLRPSDMFPYYAPEKGVSDEIPEWAKRRDLKTHVDTKKKLGNLPRRVTPKAKKKLKLRTKREIFGSKECQDWYMEKLRAV